MAAAHSVLSVTSLMRWSSSSLRRHLHTAASLRHAVLFFGSDAFSVQTLQKLHENMQQQDTSKRVVTRLEVVCVPEEGKHSHVHRTAVSVPARVFAQQHNLKLHDAPPKGQWRDWVKERPDFDFGVVVSFGRLLPGSVLSMFKRGIVNVHPSLLPRHRGAAPIHHTLLEGDAQTGVCIIELSRDAFDEGNILKYQRLPVPPRATRSLLTATLGEIGATMVVDVLTEFDHYKNNTIKQSAATGLQPSHAPKVGKAAGRVDWANSSVAHVDRLFRTLGEEPGLYTSHNGANLRLVQVDASVPVPASHHQHSPPGTCVYDGHTKLLFVKCSDGWIAVQEVRLPARKTITAHQFANQAGLLRAPHTCLFTAAADQKD